jgi:hypothetical protein
MVPRQLGNRPSNEITIKDLHLHYAEVAQSVGGRLPPFEELLDRSPATLSTKLDKARAYVRRLGVSRSSQNDGQSGHAFINGAHFLVDEVSANLNVLSQSALYKLMCTRLLPNACKKRSEFKCSIYNNRYSFDISEKSPANFIIIFQLYLRAVGEDTDVSSFFYNLPVCRARRNENIFPAANKPLRTVDLADLLSRTEDTYLRTGFLYPCIYFRNFSEPCLFLTSLYGSWGDRSGLHLACGRP